MQPAELSAAGFSTYPLQAGEFARQHLILLRQLPLALAVIVLREVIRYDWRFPAERRTLESQFSWLESLPAEKRNQILGPFAQLSLSKEIAAFAWVSRPQEASEQMTADLWATHQIDGYHAAASNYAEAWRKDVPETAPSTPRLCVAVLGPGLRAAGYPLFRKLRPHGVFFPQVDPASNMQAILDKLSARLAAEPLPHQHWYIDGGLAEAWSEARITRISWGELEPLRTAILQRMQSVIARPDAGPELLRTVLAETTPADVGLAGSAQDQVLSRFKISVFTEGSGTQIFATTFAQWTVREALRRAQPSTMVVRFAPRQRQLPMDQLLARTNSGNVPDPEGSLIDADMGVFYTWINQQRLTGSAQASFVAWSQELNQAVAVGPGFPRGTVSSTRVHLRQLLA